MGGAHTEKDGGASRLDARKKRRARRPARPRLENWGWALDLCSNGRGSDPTEDGPRTFTYEELEKAKRIVIGKGAFGVVYRASFPGDMTVAIKEMGETSSEHVKRAFNNEVRIMKRLNHRNILRFLGWCKEEEHLLLVYEIMENGNLENHLYPRTGSMDSGVYAGEVESGTYASSHLGWRRRRNILIGIASGLAYLHTECQDAIVHRDIKPANVLLDRDFNAKLADFGLVTDLSHTQTSRATDNVIGTRSYIDPAYVETGKACGQSDVYSLGVMLLEIVCGKKPIIQPDGSNDLIEMVRRCEGDNRILDAAESGLRGKYDLEIKTVLQLGLKCVREDRYNRPHTGRVRQYLLELANQSSSPSVSANGTAVSTSHNSQPSEEVFGTHSPGDEEAGVSPLLNKN